MISRLVDMSVACLGDDDRKGYSISGMAVERGKVKYSEKISS
jgi:hypothetical protein